MMRVGLIGHWGGNIGHDIMAAGLECVLHKAFDGQVEFERIEQHRPLEIYPRWHPLRPLPWLQHARGGGLATQVKRLINEPRVSRLLWPASWVDRLQLGIVCGGPLITPNISRGDVHLMFHHVLGAFASKGLPVLNLSVGSCYRWEAAPEELTIDGDSDFFRRVFEYSTVTTVRDELAQTLLAGMGEHCELVRDSGFMAGPLFSSLGAAPQPGRYIVINYLPNGAHQNWGQQIDPAQWSSVMKTVVARLRTRHEVVFVCHTDWEEQAASALDPSITRFRPQTMKEYADVIAGAKAGICGRIHAAIPLASIGVPAVGIGTDSRLGTLSAIGLPVFYVKNVTAEHLESVVESLIANAAAERDRLVTLREQTAQRYVDILRQVANN